MNQAHLEFLASPEWARMLDIRLFHEDDIFVPLGDDTIAPRLAAVGFVEIDAEAGDYDIRFSARKPT